MSYTHITKYTTKNQVERSFYGNYAPEPTGVTLHHWGSDGQDFDAVCHFLSTNNTPTSAHYVVEAGKIATLAVPTVATYHAGNGFANGTTVGIEIRPEYSDETLETVATLIYELEVAYGPLKVYQHKDFFNTACAGRWGAKIPEIVARVNEKHTEAKKPTVSPASTKSTDTTKETDMRPIDVWAYTNQKVNGAKDAYALLTECVRLLRRIAEKVGA